MRLLLTLALPIALSLAAHSNSGVPAKGSLESQTARQTLDSVLSAVNDTWFGKVYQDINAVDIQGSLSIQSVPPPTAHKRSSGDLEIAVLGGLTQNILELQRSGLKLRSVSLGGVK